jgi:hypothetical protein
VGDDKGDAAAATARSGEQAMLLVILAAAWKEISYNFLFFLAGLQAIPLSLLEASAIDGASPRRRFWTIVFPLLAPTSFFLLVVNIVYAFFDTFGVIHNVTQGGPAKATEILVYKVWYDGIVGLDLGSSAAQSRLDGDRHHPDRDPVPLHRAPGALRMTTAFPSFPRKREPRASDGKLSLDPRFRGGDEDEISSAARW